MDLAQAKCNLAEAAVHTFYMAVAVDMLGKSVDMGKERGMLDMEADNSLVDKDKGTGSCRHKDMLAKDKAADSSWGTAWVCKNA
jgi:hypothetical protein